MARMRILGAEGMGGALAEWYRVAWAPLANLALDLTVPRLAAIMPLEWAGRTFLCLTLGMQALGVMVLHRALHGRGPIWASLWPLIGLFFLHDHILSFGLLNYLFGIGLYLIAFALWIVMANGSSMARILVAAVFAVALYFSHLFALGVFGLAVLGFEAPLLVRLRWSDAIPALGVVAIPFAAPALLILFGPHEGGSGGIIFGPIARKADLLFTVLDSTWRPFDVATALILVGLLAWGFWRGRLRLHPRMRLPLILLFTAYLAMPTALMTATNVDRRLPIALVLTLVSSITPVTAGLNIRRATIIAAGLLALFVARMGLIESLWLRQDAAYAELTPAFALIERGASVAVGHPARALQMVPRAPPIVHLPLMAVTTRDAFVPTLFANPTQQPVALTPRALALARDASPEAVWRALVDEPAASADSLAAIARFDYVLLLDHRPFEPRPPRWLTLIYERPNWRLYRVVHEADMSPAGSN